jgi:hypothetical protein
MHHALYLQAAVPERHQEPTRTPLGTCSTGPVPRLWYLKEWTGPHGSQLAWAVSCEQPEEVLG